MKRISIAAMIAGSVLLTSHSPKVEAQEFDFTVSAGYPYFVVLEPSINLSDGQSRVYGQYKIGLDDGFALGYEQTFGDSNHHAMGVLVGAVGIDSDNESCDANNDAISDILVCPFIELFDDETVNGVGLSYSYYFDGMDQDGWRLRIELGYGEANDSGIKSGTGGVTLGYKF